MLCVVHSTRGGKQCVRIWETLKAVPLIDIAIFRENQAIRAKSSGLSSYRTLAPGSPQSSGNSADARLRNEYFSLNPGRGGSGGDAVEDDVARVRELVFIREDCKLPEPPGVDFEADASTPKFGRVVQSRRLATHAPRVPRIAAGPGSVETDVIPRRQHCVGFSSQLGFCQK